MPFYSQRSRFRFCYHALTENAISVAARSSPSAFGNLAIAASVAAGVLDIGVVFVPNAIDRAIACHVAAIVCLLIHKLGPPLTRQPRKRFKNSLSLLTIPNPLPSKTFS